ncbi:MAG: discoidin domain-containing protein [candidate division KSB1 bacterium]|nr:discoidin domain-containing protein [candidate division KSB1 bacterium]MDZ7406838.1 discoidin domain-containing protein [candidate division KSB1 bacterium]
MPNKAHFYFKAINGAVVDNFYVISNVIPPQPPAISSFSPTDGPFGTEVTINGSNFTGATQVRFNDVAVGNFAIVSESQIRAEVPAGATTGKISVTTPGGTTASADDFIVTPPQQPAISFFIPLNGPVGTQVTIAGNFFTGATEVAFNGMAASNFTVVSNSQIRANVPTGASTGKITVTAPGGVATSASDFTVTILSTANLALNKPASASSTEGSNTPSKAVDGNTSTYWRSGGSSTSWLRVDLGSEQTVGRAVIKWYSSYYAKQYQFQVSNNDANWTTVYTNNSGSKGTNQFNFTQTTARYVRLYMTKNNKSSYRVTELEVYSSAASALAGDKAEDTNPAASPKEIVLLPNYPNPFNPSTTIAYSIPEAKHITIKVYDLAGHEVATLVNGYQDRGDYQVIFDATDKPSGFYFVVLKADAEIYVRRLLLMK